MARWPQIVGIGLLGLALLVGVGVSQDTKKEEKKAKGILPAGFKDLALSATQKEKIYLVMADYKVKISELDKQIKELKKQEQQDIFKILTDEQRDKYLKSKGIDTKDNKDKDDKKEPDKK